MADQQFPKSPHIVRLTPPSNPQPAEQDMIAIPQADPVAPQVGFFQQPQEDLAVVGRAIPWQNQQR